MDQLRRETARRAIVVTGAKPAEAPMVVAACALLIGSGRADFSENEIRREVDALAAELRQRVGFTEEQIQGALETWAFAENRLADALPDSTFRLWVLPFRGAGIAGGRLWLAPVGERGGASVGWAVRRFRSLFESALDESLSIGFLGADPQRKDRDA